MAQFQLIREIGKGGMGCVYEGISPDNRRVAIKMMKGEVSCNPEFRELFETEAKILRAMNHPNVVKIVGDTFFDENNNMYLPMEYVEGQTLAQYVREHGPMSEDLAVTTMRQILDAMYYVHSTNNIHRDIKPSNIMLKPDGSICIIDFGIAKDMKTHTGHTIGRIIGTDGYMSPEQAKGDNVDHRTDIYSLGCVFFYMLTGDDAIKKKQNDYATTCAILQDELPSVRQYNPGLSSHLDDVIRKAADKNMTMRYQTALDFKQALGGTAIYNRARVIVGRRPNCDIVMDSQYVSGNHLNIEFVSVGDQQPLSGYLIITDLSTNGTGINGQYVHNSSYNVNFTFDNNCYSELPDVLLAGREECRLDWLHVIGVLKSILNIYDIDQGEDTARVQEERQDEGDIVDVTHEEMSPALVILSFLFPIVGFILWGIWRKDSPKKASNVVKAAWIGFGVGMVLCVISCVVIFNSIVY